MFNPVHNTALVSNGFRPPPVNALTGGWYPEDIEDMNSQYAVMRRSTQRRTHIYELGGRGWWSEKYESRVVWPEGPSPRDDEETRAKCEACLDRKLSGASIPQYEPHRLVLGIPEPVVDKTI
jgi:hypothetical protein